ncbi:MAG: hypothetical protein HQRvContig02_23 [Haloquadratum phage sp.]|nr:MAG: hypothetical protein HQRvContig02_23 [Haloquadratum phage sp.]
MSETVALTHSLSWRVELGLGIAILIMTAAGLAGSGLKTGFEFSTWEQLLVAFNCVMGTVASLSGIQKYRTALNQARSQIPEELR